jgi:predicted transposase YbfD/YdcC
MQNTVISPLKNQLLQLTDPRLSRRRKHELIDVLMIAVTALLCGAENFTHMAQFGQAKESWLRTFLTLAHGIPSHDTFRRVFMLLAPEKFSAVFLRWTQSLRQAVGAEVVALDGKTVRRSFDSAKSQSAIHLVSAWASTNRLVLGQIKVDDKSNEITAVPELLRALELAGCIVTVDALNCQKNIAKEIKEADYVLALKGNHETAHEEIRTFLDAALEETRAAKPPGAKLSAGAATLAACETVDKGHGRMETRRYYQSAALDWFADRAAWEGLTTVGMVEARREVRGKLTVERRYYLSSLPLDIATFARAVRAHWGVLSLHQAHHLNVEIVSAHIPVDAHLLGVGFQVIVGHSRTLADALAGCPDYVQPMPRRRRRDLDAIQREPVLARIKSYREQIPRWHRRVRNGLC